VCLTAALTGSCEAAARLSAKWGSVVDDEAIRTHVRRVGQRAEAQAQASVRDCITQQRVPPERGGKGDFSD
jgi:hypothetical protein